MRLVLDTNVVISAFISPGAYPSHIVKLVLGRKADICYNSVILSEYENVMMRPKFSGKIDTDIIHRFINLISSIGFPFDPFPSAMKLPDESDRIFYDTAKGSGSILVSGNIKHYPKESFIMPPAHFVKYFGEK